MTNTYISTVPEKYQVMLENYASILEKTNQQLGLWSNPYGIMIGILALLFAIAAIVVSIILVNNSRDMKKRQNDFFDEQTRIANENSNKLEKIMSVRYEEAQKVFDDLINNQKNQLKNADRDNKLKIERAISDLRKEKASLGLNLSLGNTQPGFGYGGNISDRQIGLTNPLLNNTIVSSTGIREIICGKCLKSYQFHGFTIPFCPYCGTAN